MISTCVVKPAAGRARPSAFAATCLLLATTTVLFSLPAPAQTTVQQAAVEKARALEARGLTGLAAQTWQQVLLAQPDNPDALAGLARAAKKQGNDAEAARLLARLRQINPKDPQIAAIASTVSTQMQNQQRTQAAALAAAHNYAGAMQLYRQAYGDQPTGEVALPYYETEAATEDGRAHAIAGLRSLVKLHPQEPLYAVTLGRVLTYNPKSRAEGEAILQKLPQEAGAQSALRQALLWDAQNPASAPAIRNYLSAHPDRELASDLQATETLQSQQPRGLAETPAERAAYDALQANQVDRAEQAFAALLKKAPSNPRALAGMGFVHMKQGNFDQAVSDLEAARQHGLKDRSVESALDTAHFWQTMGQGSQALQQDQLDLASQKYRAALAQRPNNSDALGGLAGTLLRDRHFAEAQGIYARWVKVQPNAVPAWRGYFSATAQAGQPQQALAVSQRFTREVRAALATDPEYLLALVTVYRAAGDEAQATQTLNQALDLPFADQGKAMTPALRMQYASVLAAAGRQQQAAKLYREVLTAQPENAQAWRGLTLAQHQMHDDAAAVETLEQMPRAAYDDSRHDPGFLSMAAAAYQQQGQSDQAQALLQQAEALLQRQGSQPSPDMLLQMASIEQQRNHPQAAAVLYQRVLQSEPQGAAASAIFSATVFSAAWSGRLAALHQAGEDARALQELANIPPQVQSELAAKDDYLITLSAIYAATGHSRWALTALARMRASYAAGDVQAPADVELQIGWLLLRAGEEGSLYETLMTLGARGDLTDAQHKQVQTIWATWSVRRANQAAAAGSTRSALNILNTARDALGGNDEVSRSLAGGYPTAGDAPAALAIYQTLELSTTQDYQGAIGAALASPNLKLAESWLRVALERYPRDPKVLALAARFEQARGDQGRGRAYWEASLAASPESDAGDRLAKTLRPSRSAGKGHNSPPADTLAALLDPDGTRDRKRFLLPGEPIAPPALAIADDPVGLLPQPSSTSQQQPGVRQKLRDYQPPAEVPASMPPVNRHLNTPGLPSPNLITPGSTTAQVEMPRVLGPFSQTSARPKPGDAEPATALTLHSPMPAADRLPSPAAPGQVAGRSQASETSPRQDPGGRLTLRYASSGGPDAPQLQRVPEQQQVPQTSGLTDEQLLDAHLPTLSRNYAPALASNVVSARQEAQQQIASIDGGFSPWVGGTGNVHHRSGTPGFDQLTALEAPFEVSTPLGTGARLTAITTAVFLDGGEADGTSTLSFGSIPQGKIQPQQYADGVANELQLTAIHFAARVGESPYGFLVTNLTGGVRWQPAGGPLTLAFSREAVKDTQLSYSGLRDPGSATATFDGRIWGGVVANAGDVQVAHGDALSGFYAGVGGQYITGRHVQTNTRFHGNAGAYWRVVDMPDLGTLVLGANFFGMHYAHNLRYFTYGQGGYFSPEAYFVAAMPLSWTGHYGPDVHYAVTGSVGVQSFQENSSPYYPLDPGLQAVFRDPLVPVRSSVGTNFDLQTEMAYRVQDHWYVGGFLDFNNTRDYESQSGGFFVRYLFRPQPDAGPPIGAFPRDGYRPVMVP